MKRLALLARADNGGIANQTWQFARRMKPDKILVCHTAHTTRGESKPNRYLFEYGPELATCERAPKTRHAEWLLDGVDAVFTVECWYGPAIPEVARRKGVKTVVQGNPEMTADEPADVMWAPTPWRLDALPGDPVIMPFPTDLELLPPREPRETIRTIYHTHSTAMCDRNGTELLLEAAGRINSEVKIKVRSTYPARIEHRGLATIEWVPHHDGMFYDAWPEDADLFVLPRRFGGLSLPIQEAMSLGLPVIALGCPPQEWMLPRTGLVKARVETYEKMRGGGFEPHGCQPAALASKINEVIAVAHIRKALIAHSRTWAQAHSWEELGPKYEEVLR